MGTMTHKIERAAFSKAIDMTLKKAKGNWEVEAEKLIELMQKYMSGEKLDIDYEKAKQQICDKNTTLNQYINRLMTEVDTNVLKTVALNLGFEAFFYGTKTIREMREVHQCNVPWLILMQIYGPIRYWKY